MDMSACRVARSHAPIARERGFIGDACGATSPTHGDGEVMSGAPRLLRGPI